MPSLHDTFHTICIDLEFSYGKKKLSQIDIYEIGAVKIDENGIEIDSFQTHVKPAGGFCSKTLNFLNLGEADFCEAVSIEEALAQLDAFAAKSLSTNTNWCSWGDFDQQLLDHKSRNNGLLKALKSQTYFDAQVEFQAQANENYHINRTYSLCRF